MKRWFLLLPVLFLFAGCQGIPTGQISNLQKKIDEISKKIETGEGLKAKKGIEDIEKKLAELEKKIDKISEKLDKLDARYTSHVKKYHR
ncbi:hypothetical protein KAW48_08010 [candidate division WOR-3 bacterium]|nr:hypothetical protein [candidate division WOR-3 bacterium]